MAAQLNLEPSATLNLRGLPKQPLSIISFMARLAEKCRQQVADGEQSAVTFRSIDHEFSFIWRYAHRFFA